MSDKKRLLFHCCKLSSTAIRDLRQHGITPIKVEHLYDIKFFGEGEWEDVLIDALETIVEAGNDCDVRGRFYAKRRAKLLAQVKANRGAEKTA